MAKIKPITKKRINDVLSASIYFVSSLFLFGAVFLMLLGFFSKPLKGEATIGDFGVLEFNDNWRIQANDMEENVTLPYVAKASEDEWLIARNTIPDYVDDGMNLTFRAAMEDVYIYVDGELRNSYASENFDMMGYYLNSAYIVTPLSASDAGKAIEMRILVKNKPVVEKVTLAYGNNAWFQVVKDNTFIVLAALVLIIFGACSVIGYFCVKRHITGGKAIIFIGLLMVDVGIWLLSESPIRQMVLYSPSFTLCASIWSIEIVGVLAALYFDEVQRGRYHILFLTAEIAIAAQALINTVLHFADILELHQTLISSHILMFLGLIMFMYTIIRDIIIKEIEKYRITSIGMIIFAVTSFIEFVSYYLFERYRHGFFICVGLLVLLITTVTQTVADEVARVRRREKEREEANLKTMETIASSVYAKDEYTGGHASRVSIYLTTLAKEMRDEYNLSDDDIVRFGYIGLMHDIGKIAVPDAILNKAGKLDEDEYTLMKRHTIVGDKLLKAMDQTDMGYGIVGNLNDGIRHHHERYDGTGYPDGLKGEDISIVARMICLADCYDAMTSNRVYRKRIPDNEVIEEIERCSGTQFDPRMSEVFVGLIKDKKIKPETREGLDADDNGKIKLASLLEERLRNDNENALNPSFVRMLCFIVKISEEEKEKVSVYFMTTPDYLVTKKMIEDEKDEVANIAKEELSGLDLSIRYTDDTMLYVFFDKNDDTVEEIMGKIAAKLREKKIESVVSKLQYKSHNRKD